MNGWMDGWMSGGNEEELPLKHGIRVLQNRAAGRKKLGKQRKTKKQQQQRFIQN